MNGERREITPDEMQAALLRSGYLLEQRVRLAVEEQGYFVQGNAAYPDELTGKSRELDIHALDARTAGPGELDFVFSVILSECVNNLQPLVFFIYDSPVGFLHHQEAKFSGLPTQIVEKDNSWTRLSEFLRFEDFHHYCTDRVSTQYCSFTQKRGTHEWEAIHVDEHHDSFNTLTMALESEIQEHYKGWVIEKDEEEAINLQFYYPMLVLQGTLFVAKVLDGSVEVNQVEHVQYRREIFSAQRHETYQIDVITESYLPDLLKAIDGEMKRIAFRMKRNKRRVRESINALVEQVDDASDKGKLRKVLDWDYDRR